MQGRALAFIAAKESRAVFSPLSTLQTNAPKAAVANFFGKLYGGEGDNSKKEGGKGGPKRHRRTNRKERQGRKGRKGSRTCSNTTNERGSSSATRAPALIGSVMCRHRPFVSVTFICTPVQAAILSVGRENERRWKMVGKGRRKRRRNSFERTKLRRTFDNPKRSSRLS